MTMITLLLAILGIGFGWFYLLWLYYLAVMSLESAQDKAPITGATRLFAYTVLGPGYLLDFLTNLVLVSILFLEVPREWLVTARLVRHIEGSIGWRRSLAEWFCATLLDRFDPSGCHCKKKEG